MENYFGWCCPIPHMPCVKNASCMRATTCAVSACILWTRTPPGNTYANCRATICTTGRASTSGPRISRVPCVEHRISSIAGMRWTRTSMENTITAPVSIISDTADHGTIWSCSNYDGTFANLTVGRLVALLLISQSCGKCSEKSRIWSSILREGIGIFTNKVFWNPGIPVRQYFFFTNIYIYVQNLDNYFL